MDKENKQTIKCDVHTCKYNNTDNHMCELDEVKISCTCDNDDCDNTNDTICYSFEESSLDEDEENEEEE